MTNSDALVPTVLAGLTICELPDVIAADYVCDGRLVPVPTEWAMPAGRLYFVTPSARGAAGQGGGAGAFFAEHLSRPAWRL